MVIVNPSLKPNEIVPFPTPHRGQVPVSVIVLSWFTGSIRLVGDETTLFSVVGDGDDDIDARAVTLVMMMMMMMAIMANILFAR